MITRFDTAPINELTVDPQTGYLHASNVPIARVGVFPYLHSDGTWTNEAKLPEDILSESTVKSANNKPVTNDHPVDDGENVLVDKSNSTQYVKGFTADNAHVEGDMLKVGLTIMDPQLIDAVQNGGKQELSIGFQTDVEPISGEYNGAKYDSVQRNIQINHVAVVDRAREGHNIRITGDSAQMVVNDTRKEKQMAENEKNVFDDADNTSSNTNSASSNTSSSSNSSSSSSSDDKDKQIADLKQQVKDLQAQLASKNSNSNSQDDSDDDDKDSKSKYKSDSVDAEIEKLKEERDMYKSKVEGDSFNTTIDERIDLIDDAKKILGDSYDFHGKSNHDIKVAAIKKADSTIKVDGMDDSFINGVYAVIKNRKPGVVGYPRQETLSDAADDTVNKAKQARANLYYSKNK